MVDSNRLLCYTKATAEQIIRGEIMSEETIGTRIANLRSQYSYSQEYVAEKIGVSRQAVSKWEQNQTSPDTDNLIALSQLFNVTVEYLAIGKIQEQKAEKQQTKTTQKTIGYILLSTGLVSLLLGIIIDFVLIIVSAYLIVAGIMLLVIKNNLLKILTGALLSITLVLIGFTTGVNNIGVIFLFILALVIIITLIKIYDNKNSAE